MKKLMFAMVAALSFAVMAQDAEGPKPGPKDGVRRGMRDRAAMLQRAGFGEMMGDPSVMAVMNPKIAEKIGLSADVREQIKKLDADNREQVRGLQAKTRAAVEKQAGLMKADKIDEAAVMTAIDELFECRKEMAKLQTKRLIGVKSMLTKEQISKAAEAMKEMKAMRDEHREKRGAKPGAKPEAQKPACAKPEACADK